MGKGLITQHGSGFLLQVNCFPAVATSIAVEFLARSHHIWQGRCNETVCLQRGWQEASYNYG